MKILALSGSLRAASENTRLLRVLARLAPPDVAVTVYTGLGDLPLFNPDIEFPNPPAVEALRATINAADAIVIASPEYAHGVTAVIKNALDWMVGNESFVAKPVALLNAAPRASHAYQALRETVTMMSARVIDSACMTLASPISGMSETELLQHPAHREALQNVLREIAKQVPLMFPLIMTQGFPSSQPFSQREKDYPPSPSGRGTEGEGDLFF